jgi:hypothetical protein
MRINLVEKKEQEKEKLLKKEKGLIKQNDS